MWGGAVSEPIQVSAVETGEGGVHSLQQPSLLGGRKKACVDVGRDAHKSPG